MGRVYLVTDCAEIERRRRTLPGVLIEVWPDLHAGDLFWLGDEERRRAAYTAATRDARPDGLYWIGETSKAALDATGGGRLAWELAIDESLVPVYYGPWLADADSLPQEESLRARALSAHAIAVAWSTYDRTGRRIEHRPASPLDATFHLRRPRGRALHLFHAFRTQAEALAAMGDRMADDPGACAWAASLPVPDFPELMKRARRAGAPR
jgi:hypothetical protein